MMDFDPFNPVFPPIRSGKTQNQRPRCLCWEREDRWLLALCRAGAEATWELCPVASGDTPGTGCNIGEAGFLVISADVLDQPIAQAFISSLVHASPPIPWVAEIPPDASPLLSLWLNQSGAAYLFDSPLQAPELLGILQRQAAMLLTNQLDR